MQEIKIKYFNNDIDKIEKYSKGDWIDLRAAKDITLAAGEMGYIPLGVAMKLPDGYEAHIAPRSSTFKNWGILQTNSVAVIDNSYCGPEDEWKMPVYATKDTKIEKNSRICQFRIIKIQPEIAFIEDSLEDNQSRGGFGTSGIK